MKILSLFSACIAVAFCTLAVPALPVSAVAQDIVATAVQPASTASLFTSSAAVAVTALVALAIVAGLFVLVVRSDRSRAGPIDPEEVLYHDPWRIPDRC